jgi:hypothetical protein
MEQVGVGIAVTMLCILVSGLGFWLAEVVFTHGRGWLRARPHSLKLLAVVIGTGALVLAVVLGGVAIWGAALTWYRIFPNFQDSFYFALVSYTTVGYGELLPPAEWRLLGAMAAANGFINIGLLTTLLIEGLGHVRSGYHHTVLGDEAVDD